MYAPVSAEPTLCNTQASLSPGASSVPSLETPGLLHRTYSQAVPWKRDSFTNMALKPWKSRNLDEQNRLLLRSGWVSIVVPIFAVIQAFSTWASQPNPYNPLGASRIMYQGFENSSYAKGVVGAAALSILAMGVVAISSNGLVRVSRLQVVVIVSGIIFAGLAVGGIVEIHNALARLEPAPRTICIFGLSVALSSALQIRRVTAVKNALAARDLVSLSTPPASTQVGVSHDHSSDVAALKDLFELRNAGAITELEFESKKRQILGE